MKNLDDRAETIIVVKIKHRFSGGNCRLPRDGPGFDSRPMQSSKAKSFAGKAQTKFFHFLLLHEFKTSIRLKQSFHDFVQSFDKKIGLKIKILFKRLK